MCVLMCMYIPMYTCAYTYILSALTGKQLPLAK